MRRGDMCIWCCFLDSAQGAQVCKLDRDPFLHYSDQYRKNTKLNILPINLVLNILVKPLLNFEIEIYSLQ